MFGDRGLGERQFVDDVAARPSLLAGEHPEDADAKTGCAAAFANAANSASAALLSSGPGIAIAASAEGSGVQHVSGWLLVVHRLSSMDGNLCAVRISWNNRQSPRASL